MSFEQYLESKKIDFDLFRKSEQDEFDRLKSIFDKMHPDSFTAQKLFLINPLRRKYQLKKEEVKVEKKAVMKPRIPKPKPKI